MAVTFRTDMIAGVVAVANLDDSTEPLRSFAICGGTHIRLLYSQATYASLPAQPQDPAAPAPRVCAE
jgi:hypothetical protein